MNMHDDPLWHGGVALDAEIVHQAKRGFHIRDPLMVVTMWSLDTITQDHENTCGLYRAWLNGTHIIYVKDQGCVESTRTLWHEMTHVQQAERLGSYARFIAERIHQKREAGITPLLWDGFEYRRRYNQMPQELEANVNAHALIAEPDMPLAYHINSPGKLIQSVLID